MKRLFTFIVFIAIVVSLFGQSPEKMTYQAVVRNTEGVLVQSRDIGIRISILKGSTDGTSVFTETHTATTNTDGLVSLEIGTGTTSDDFSSIVWGTGPYFLKTETDPTGGIDYTITGISQILSVPYALYAKTAENGFSGNYEDLSNKPSLSVSENGDTLFLDMSNFVIVPGISAANPPAIQDIDGNVYKTVVIGTQTWMAENLKTIHYSNGGAIPIISTYVDWSNQTTEACYEMYLGNYYNWFVVENGNICPTGWQVPGNTEWTILSDYLGGASIAGGKMKLTGGWCCGNIGATNESGFSGSSSGYIMWNGDVDEAVGFVSSYWSSTEYNTVNAYSWGLNGGSASFGYYVNGANKRNGYSIRCIKD